MMAAAARTAVVLTMLLGACHSPARSGGPNHSTAAVGAGDFGSWPWTQRYDFDGDGVRDTVEFAFSGGAHCCYALSIVGGADGSVTRIPFELDGGYVGGIDLSRPERFDIAVDAAGRGTLLLEVATYGGEPQPLVPEWRSQWGVRSHRIAVSLKAVSLKGGLQVTNLGWSCDRASTAVARGLWSAWEGLPAGCGAEALAHAMGAELARQEPGTLGAIQRPVSRYFAIRAEHHSKVIFHAAAGAVVRIDLEMPVAVANAVIAARGDESSNQVGGWQWWPSGIAIQRLLPGAVTGHIALVPATDWITFQRLLMTSEPRARP